MERAVIKTGGKQYIVKPGETVEIEKIKGDFKVGDSVDFNEVLLVEKDGKIEIGKPTVAGVSVKGKIEEIGREKKVIVIHFKSKTRERKKAGHRQPFFRVSIQSIA